MSQHPLAVWLAERGLSATEFARRLGVSPNRISELVRRKRVSTPWLAFAVEKETGGAVRWQDCCGRVVVSRLTRNRSARAVRPPRPEFT